MFKAVGYVILFLTVFTFWPVCAETINKETKAVRVGIVDGEKVFDEYSFAQEATKKITDAQDQLKQQIEESEKTYTEFAKQKKSEAEKLTKQKELQADIDAKAQSTRKMIESLSSKIESEILQAIKTISTEKGLDVIFDKRAVLFGGTDVTQSVVNELKKKSPIAGEKWEKKDVETPRRGASNN